MSVQKLCAVTFVKRKVNSTLVCQTKPRCDLIKMCIISQQALPPLHVWNHFVFTFLWSILCRILPGIYWFYPRFGEGHVFGFEKMTFLRHAKIPDFWVWSSWEQVLRCWKTNLCTWNVCVSLGYDRNNICPIMVVILTVLDFQMHLISVHSLGMHNAPTSVDRKCSKCIRRAELHEILFI